MSARKHAHARWPSSRSSNSARAMPRTRPSASARRSIKASASCSACSSSSRTRNAPWPHSAFSSPSGESCWHACSAGSKPPSTSSARPTTSSSARVRDTKAELLTDGSRSCRPTRGQNDSVGADSRAHRKSLEVTMRSWGGKRAVLIPLLAAAMAGFGAACGDGGAGQDEGSGALSIHEQSPDHEATPHDEATAGAGDEHANGDSEPAEHEASGEPAAHEPGDEEPAA